MPDGDFTKSAANGAPGCAVGTSCELGAAANLGFYDPSKTPSVTYANDVTHGFGNREYDWQLSASVEQEITRGINMSFGFYRTWFGNFSVAQNTAIPAADYTQYCVTPATNPSYPGFNNQLCNLYDPDPSLLPGGALPQATWVVHRASKFGKESDVFTGVDLAVNARYHRLTLQGGISAGNEVTDYCVQVNSPQDLTWASNPSPISTAILDFPNFNFTGVNDAAPCKISPSWYQDLQFKAAAVYALPWWGIKVSATEQNLPSIPLQGTATYNANSSGITFLGGRTSKLSGVNGTTYRAEVVTPQTVFPYGRNNQLDLRFSKVFSIKERWQIEPTADFFNILNASTILGIQTTYNGSAAGTAGAWRNVTNLLPARLIEFGVHVDF
jgi:hypothetical protein